MHTDANYGTWITQKVSEKTGEKVFMKGWENWRDTFVEDLTRCVFTDNKPNFQLSEFGKKQLDLSTNVVEWVKIRTQLPNKSIDETARLFLKRMGIYNLVTDHLFSAEKKLLQHLFFEAVKKCNAQEINDIKTRKTEKQEAVVRMANHTQNCAEKILSKISNFMKSPILPVAIGGVTGVTVGITSVVIGWKVGSKVYDFMNVEVMPRIVIKICQYAPAKVIRIGGEIYARRTVISIVAIFGTFATAQDSFAHGAFKRVHQFTSLISMNIPMKIFNKIVGYSFTSGTKAACYAGAITGLASLSASSATSNLLQKKIIDPSQQSRNARELQQACDLWIEEVQSRNVKFA